MCLVCSDVTFNSNFEKDRCEKKTMNHITISITKKIFNNFHAIRISANINKKKTKNEKLQLM